MFLYRKSPHIQLGTKTLLRTQILVLGDIYLLFIYCNKLHFNIILTQYLLENKILNILFIYLKIFLTVVFMSKILDGPI